MEEKQTAPAPPSDPAVVKSSRPQLSNNFKDYDLKGILGKGAFATVWLAHEAKTNGDYAVKIIELESNNPLTIEETRKETKIMHSLQHENVVACLASFVVMTELWLVMPLLRGGSCAMIMRTHPEFSKGFQDEALLATIMKDVVQGLEYFHKESRIHRDIKAGNILLSEAGVAKISDFGVSGALIENGYKKTGRMTFTGTPCWMAPEVMESKGHNHKADIWSLGITALELAYAKPPYADQRPMKVMLMIIQNEPPSVDAYKDFDKNKDAFSKDFHRFVKTLLRKEPKRRPTAKQLLKDAYFKKAKSHEYVRNRVLSSLPPQKLKPHDKADLPKSLTEPLGEAAPRTIGLSFDFSADPKSQSGNFTKSKLGILQEVEDPRLENQPLAQQNSGSRATIETGVARYGR